MANDGYDPLRLCPLVHRGVMGDDGMTGCFWGGEV